MFKRRKWRLLKGHLLFFKYLQWYSASVSIPHSDRKAWASDNSKRKLYLFAFKVHSYLEPRQNLGQPKWHGEIVQNRAQNKALSTAFHLAQPLPPGRKSQASSLTAGNHGTRRGRVPKPPRRQVSQQLSFYLHILTGKRYHSAFSNEWPGSYGRNTKPG